MVNWKLYLLLYILLLLIIFAIAYAFNVYNTYENHYWYNVTCINYTNCFISYLY